MDKRWDKDLGKMMETESLRVAASVPLDAVALDHVLAVGAVALAAPVADAGLVVDPAAAAAPAVVAAAAPVVVVAAADPVVVVVAAAAGPVVVVVAAADPAAGPDPDLPDPVVVGLAAGPQDPVAGLVVGPQDPVAGLVVGPQDPVAGLVVDPHDPAAHQDLVALVVLDHHALLVRVLYR